MKSCNVGEEDFYYWGGIRFKTLFSGCIKFPQVLVAEYPNMDKVLFEVKMDIDNLSFFIEEIPVLPGSVINGNDGGLSLPVYKGAGRGIVMTRFVRVPNIEELDFYERYSKL